MSALIVDKEKKREDIILAALEVFAEKGFQRTTIKDIAERAGIGKGTVYEYFKDKDEIIRNSFYYFQKFFEFDIQNTILSSKNGIEKLSDLIKSITKILRSDNEKYIDLVFDFWAEGIKGHSKKLMLNEMNMYYKSYRNLFEDVLNEGIEDGSFRRDMDPVSVASIIIGMLDGIMVQWILEKNVMKGMNIEKSILDLVLKGTGAGKTNREKNR